MNKQLIKSRFSANYQTYNDHATVQKQVVEELIHLLPQKKYNKILEIGCGTGLLSDYLKKFEFEKLYLNDICEEVTTIISSENFPLEFLIGDAENIDFPSNLDLIISANSIQWFDDLDGFFQKINNSLKKGGVFAFSTFITGNCQELMQVFNTTLSYKTHTEIIEMGEKYFNLKEEKAEIVTLKFNTLTEILSHIKNTGANAIKQGCLTKSSLLNAKHKYENLRQDGFLPLTYAPSFYVFIKR